MNSIVGHPLNSNHKFPGIKNYLLEDMVPLEDIFKALLRLLPYLA